jgi:uncharacterized protein YecE (DUF72 family)
MGRILVGTASWADPGFVEDWYPRGLPAAKRLSVYAEHFNLVEVNTSFYAIPTPRVVANWVTQTPTDFLFDVKLFQLLSQHKTTLERLPPDLRKSAKVEKGRVVATPALVRRVVRRIRESIEPLRDEQKLGALLLQMSPSFGPREHALDELDDLIDQFEGCQLAIELRNRGWIKGEYLEATEEFFHSRRVAYVTVDAPVSEHFMAMPPLDVVTDPQLAYLRAHGRNTRGYLYGKSVAARFDYDYSDAELQELGQRAAKLATLASEVHVIYNNNKSDYALRAAARTREIVEQHA